MTHRAKILVMDDDAELLDTAAQLLKPFYEVVTYRAAFNRLNAVREHHPDLVLMDVNMPLVPGDEVVRLLKESPELSGIPIVLFSSNDERSLRRMARECGALGYIPKSEMGANFAAQVGRHLRHIK
jgi:CheY-like chemotaxis protein